MRHITDGELHAYLDGALDHLPGARGDEVRQHLETCRTCRERLQDEEGIRTRAQQLLDLSAPLAVPLPPFEELRARAEASEPPEAGEKAQARYRGPLRGLPLAWAATVVLAIGVGWMGGQVWRAPLQSDLDRIEYRNSRPTSASEPGAVMERQEEAPIRFETEMESETPAAISSDVLDAATPAGLGVQEPGGRTGDETAPAAIGGVLNEAGLPPRALEQLEAREKVSGEAAPGAAPRRDAVSPEAAVLTPPVPPGDQAAGAAVLLRSRASVEDGSMLVPGLEVVTVEWEEWAPRERALHIRQLLPMGDTLELRYLGLLMGSDPDATSLSTSVAEGRAPEGDAADHPLSPKVLEASLPPGWNQVVMRWGRGWLVARARLPVESLRGILRSLH